MSIKKFVEENKILECIAGSHAYGFATPESDEDIRGITIPPIDYLIGMGFLNFEEQHYPDQDKVIYGIKKFMQLAMACNPSIIDILFMPERSITFVDKYGEMLINNRQIFLSTKARHTFSGYALAQLKRIKRHKKWIDDPPSKPNPTDYAFTSHWVLKEKDGFNMPTKVTKSHYDKYPDDRKWVQSGITSEYESDLKEYNHYMQWKKNRNPARAALEEKYKYDTKHGTHLVRLLRMGIEIVRDGKVIVDRKEAGDADEMIAIRNGSMSYEELVAYAEEKDKELKLYYDKSPLPKKVNNKKIDKLYLDIISDKYNLTWGGVLNA